MSRESRREPAAQGFDAGLSPTGAADPSDDAHTRAMIRSIGARLTGPRLRVLGELLRADRALTHLELQRRVEAGAEPIDRVTLYRVLDWLAEKGLAHRVAGPDRIFRFSARSCELPHGHFRCEQCGRMYCLDGSADLERSVLATLPRGLTGRRVEITVSGLCAECAPAH